MIIFKTVAFAFIFLFKTDEYRTAQDRYMRIRPAAWHGPARLRFGIT
jgi:hypothetical protein